MGAGPERGQLPHTLLLCCPRCSWAGHFHAWFTRSASRRARRGTRQGAEPTEAPAVPALHDVSRETLTEGSVHRSSPPLQQLSEHEEIQDERYTPQLSIPFATSTPS